MLVAEVLPLNYTRIIFGLTSAALFHASSSTSIFEDARCVEATRSGFDDAVLVAAVLPRNYTHNKHECKKKKGRLVGIEPTHARATIWCVNHFAIAAIIAIKMAGAVGIEPTPEVLETSVLPLNYAPSIMVEGDGFEPPNPKGADLQSAAFSHFATPPRNGADCRT